MSSSWSYTCDKETEVPWLPYAQVASLAGNTDISAIISTGGYDGGSGSLILDPTGI